MIQLIMRKKRKGKQRRLKRRQRENEAREELALAYEQLQKKYLHYKRKTKSLARENEQLQEAKYQLAKQTPPARQPLRTMNENIQILQLKRMLANYDQELQEKEGLIHNLMTEKEFLLTIIRQHEEEQQLTS